MLRSTAVLLLTASLAFGQDTNNPEELKKMHAEAMVQLKAAQDRKNELAAENEKLSARVVELEKQLGDRDQQIAAFSERTWFLRSHYAAWNKFMDRYPQMKERWNAFMSGKVLDAPTTLPAMEDVATG